VILEDLGWTALRARAFTELGRDDLEPARVAVQHRNRYVVYAGSGELSAVARGRLRASERPAVGDWVAISGSGSEQAVIESRLPRSSCFSRKATGRGGGEQVIAVNIDIVWVVTAGDRDFNARRLERYIALTHESGARPAIVATKADIAPLSPAMMEELAAVADGVPLHRVSGVTGDGLETLRGDLVPGCTVALLGSSGVGKSTLVNALLGEARQRVDTLRADGRGRHTTVRRELVPLPGGGLLLDTPGMRQLAFWEAEQGLAAAFGEIERLAAGCRFGDCRHRDEPGCAVLAAVETGELPASRLASYRDLDSERDIQEKRRPPGGRHAAAGRRGAGRGR
jgi:ribosome biogenesis GTPase